MAKIIDVYYDEEKVNWKEKIKRNFREVVIWVYNNKELIIICTPIVLATCKFGTKLVSKVGRNINLR